MATTGGIGILGIAWSVTHTPPLQNEAVAEVAHGIFEALFIAAFVAAIVDPFAKRRFAIEVGRSVLLALFGRNAPQRYIDGLREALRPDRITYDVQWHLQLTWHIPDQLLRIDIRIDSTLQNISERPMAPTPAWLPSSAPGSPGSRFHEYRIKVTPTDSPATAAVSRRLDADALQSAVRAAGIGWIAVDPDRALGDLRIPPGAIQDFTLAGVTYQPAPDTFLLVLSNPALSQTLDNQRSRPP